MYLSILDVSLAVDDFIVDTVPFVKGDDFVQAGVIVDLWGQQQHSAVSRSQIQAFAVLLLCLYVYFKAATVRARHTL